MFEPSPASLGFLLALLLTLRRAYSFPCSVISSTRFSPSKRSSTMAATSRAGVSTAVLEAFTFGRTGAASGQTVRIRGGLNYRASITTGVRQRLDNNGWYSRVTDGGHKTKRGHRINSKAVRCCTAPTRRDEIKTEAWPSVRPGVGGFAEPP